MVLSVRIPQLVMDGFFQGEVYEFGSFVKFLSGTFGVEFGGGSDNGFSVWEFISGGSSG